jgi:two-component sensor histidine kinase
LTPETDPRTNPRNRCIHAGYESVGLFPIPSGESIIGLLQLNDRRAGRFTLDSINFFETLTQNIGLALQRVTTEEALRESENQLRASLGEKEALLKEVHHRVKNNLQVISSLMSLQSEETRDAGLRAVFQEVNHRVRSMALVHEQLYQSADLARVDFAAYARSLLTYLWQAYGAETAGIRLTLNLEPLSLSVYTAVPLGLILNELAGNALKHAFHDRTGGEVRVALQRGPAGRVQLTVSDDGRGLPEGFDWGQARSLGLRLVQMLAGQLHADVAVSREEGTEFGITLEVKE